jgi:transposase
MKAAWNRGGLRWSAGSGGQDRYLSGSIDAVGLHDPERCVERINAMALSSETEESVNDETLCKKSRHALRPNRKETQMTYRIAGIDVHKRMLAVVVAWLSAEGEITFQRRKYENTEAGIASMGEWFAECQVQEAVMESTAQYWRTLWLELEHKFRLYLAQAMSNRAPRGRKNDFADAERLVRRFLAGELILSYVPDCDQRLWRTLAREKHAAIRARVEQINGLEGFLEQVRIKLSSVVSDLTGVSSWRILRKLAGPVTDPAEHEPAALAALAERGMKCTPGQLQAALAAAPHLRKWERILLKQMLERIDLFARHIQEIDQALAECLRPHHEAVARLSAVAGLGADSAQQIVAEIGPRAQAFPSAAHLASWIGVCPGRQESAGVSTSNRSPKGNRPMRRILALCANAAVKAKNSVFELFYRRKVGMLGHKQTIWAVAHKLCRIIWKVLHDSVCYEERGGRLNSRQAAKQLQRAKRALRLLGYDPHSIRKLDQPNPPAPAAAQG